MVVGGIIILNAWGITTNLRTWLGVKPIEAAASFWPLLTPWTPALTHSAIKVAVYKDKANANEINSGGNFRPPLKVKDVFDNCSITGISTDASTPPRKKLNNGKIIKRPIDIDKTGVWIPWFSCFFLAYALTKNIAIIAAITE